MVQKHKIKKSDKARAALASWVMTIFNAENIIDIDKLYEIKLIREDAEITYSDVSEGKKMTLEESVRILSELSESDKKVVVSVLNNLASKDQYCAPSEALLLSALEYALIKKDGAIFSIKANDLTLDGKTAYFVLPSSKLYGGPLYLKGVSDHIRRHLDEVVVLFYCFGFDFAYIPKIVEDYSKDPKMVEALKDFACNFSDFPSVDVTNAIESFSSFGTAEFTNMLFSNREKDSLEDHSEPGIIIKICDSFIAGEKYYDFIYLPILSDGISPIINTIKEFFHNYQSKVSYTSYLVTPELPNRLRHFDLYSTLLRYRIKNGEKVHSRVTIDFYNEELYFNDINYKLKLNIDIVDYLFIAWQSYYLAKSSEETKSNNMNQIAPLKEARRLLRGDSYPGDTMHIAKTFRKKANKITKKILSDVPSLASPLYYCPINYNDSPHEMLINYEIKIKDIYITDSDNRTYHISEAPISKILEKSLLNI